jgi:hypothetical protein
MMVVAFVSSLQELWRIGGRRAPPNEQILLLYAVLQSLRGAKRGGDIRAKTLVSNPTNRITALVGGWW